MSQPPPQHPPRTYSAWQQTQTPDNYLPPTKRQRIDPTPSSPFATSPQNGFAMSSNFSNIALPTGYNPQRQPNGTGQMSPPPQQQRLNAGVMGPPQRPAERSGQNQEERTEKHLDINDLSDLVTSSGIDIREEENYLAASYRSERNNASFNSQTGQVISPQSSFDLLSQSSFGAIGSQRSSDAFSQTPVKTQEQELYDKHKKAARAVNESQQHHLDDPFLLGNGVRKRMEKIVNELGVRLPLEGLFDRVPERPPSMSGTSMTDADGAGIVHVGAPSVLNRQTPLEPLLALVSLAANERLRGLLEDSYGLARNRQFTSDGIVPPDWADLAVTNGAEATTTISSSISGTPWDKAGDAADDAASGVLDEKQALPSPPISNAESTKPLPQRLPTVAFPKSNSVTLALTTLARRDRAAEEARLKLRAARASKKAAQAAAAAAATPDSSGIGEGATTPVDGVKSKLPPGMLGERAPEAKATKKELAKQAKQDLSDEVATRNANSTASMQLGGLGKSYSWMKSGGGAGSKASTPSRLGGKSGVGGSSGSGAGGGHGKHHIEGWSLKDKKYGEWREDGIDGKGIQLRDWIAVLETDGRERRSLGWAFAMAGGDTLPRQAQASQSNTPAQAQTPGPPSSQG